MSTASRFYKRPRISTVGSKTKRQWVYADTPVPTVEELSDTEPDTGRTTAATLGSAPPAVAPAATGDLFDDSARPDTPPLKVPRYIPDAPVDHIPDFSDEEEEAEFAAKVQAEYRRMAARGFRVPQFLYTNDNASAARATAAPKRKITEILSDDEEEAEYVGFVGGEDHQGEYANDDDNDDDYPEGDYDEDYAEGQYAGDADPATEDYDEEYDDDDNEEEEEDPVETFSKIENLIELLEITGATLNFLINLRGADIDPTDLETVREALEQFSKEKGEFWQTSAEDAPERAEIMINRLLDMPLRELVPLTYDIAEFRVELADRGIRI
ncbi:hypothetical protein F5Y11DRAFT_197600 [Daldinia sp. FL1419]|nr:hypothetical protein F5Y11DRAFT_197600 [Daldinia sp. FL1419]